MKNRKRFRLLPVLLLVAGCASGPRYAEVENRLPPVPVGMARLYFYRDYEPYETVARPPLYIDGKLAGPSIPGGVYYRDVAPGKHEITVFSPSLYPDQFKTVVMTAGSVYYAKIESLKSWNGAADSDLNTFVVHMMDPATARRQMENMNFDEHEAALDPAARGTG